MLAGLQEVAAAGERGGRAERARHLVDDRGSARARDQRVGRAVGRAQDERALERPRRRPHRVAVVAREHAEQDRELDRARGRDSARRRCRRPCCPCRGRAPTRPRTRPCGPAAPRGARCTLASIVRGGATLAAAAGRPKTCSTVAEASTRRPASASTVSVISRGGSPIGPSRKARLPLVSRSTRTQRPSASTRTAVVPAGATPWTMPGLAS